MKKSKNYYKCGRVTVNAEVFARHHDKCGSLPVITAELIFMLSINDTHREKLRFTQFSTKMAAWLLLTFFICFQNQFCLLYILLSPIKDYKCLKNVIYQIDSKNEWLLLSASFTAQFGLVFVLTLKNAFFKKFHFKANRKSIGSFKKRY